MPRNPIYQMLYTAGLLNSDRWHFQMMRLHSLMRWQPPKPVGVGLRPAYGNQPFKSSRQQWVGLQSNGPATRGQRAAYVELLRLCRRLDGQRKGGRPIKPNAKIAQFVAAAERQSGAARPTAAERSACA